MSEVYNIDFETGDFTELDDSVGGAALYVSSTGAISGTYSCNHDWSTLAQVVSNSTNISLPFTAFRMGCRIKVKGTFAWGSSTAANFFNFLNGSNHYSIGIVKSGASGVVIQMQSTGSTPDILGSIDINDGAVHTVEIRIIRESSPAAGDGIEALYVDGTLEGELTNAGNDSEFNDIRIGFGNWQWNKLTGSTGSGGIITDDWVLRDDDTAIFGASVTPFRFLGMDAHSGVLMIAGLDNEATLKSYVYTDLDSLTEGGTIDSFGAATDAELDARTKGIFPVVRPQWDNHWFMRGRDGSQVQLYFNDRNGTLGWVDIGPGTATWGTAKYAIGLWPEPTVPDDVIIVFSDATAWRSRYGTANWVNMGSAPFALRAGARHIANRFNELIAGAGGGTMAYSPNFGVSWDGTVGGTIAGTINRIAVSL